MDQSINLLAPDYPTMLLGFVLWGAFYIGVPIAIFLFARRVLRLLERRSIREEELATVAERVRQLEARLEDVEAENARLREDQQFTRQLLAEAPRM